MQASRRTVRTLSTAVAGPALAILYEHGFLRALSTDPLRNVWLLAAIGALGAGVGVRAWLQGSRLPGALCVLGNGAVLALYGFIGAFFATGGSR